MACCGHKWLQPWFARTGAPALGLLAAAAYRLYLYGVPAQIKSPHLPLFALMLSGLCFVPMMPGRLDKTLAPIFSGLCSQPRRSDGDVVSCRFVECCIALVWFVLVFVVPVAKMPFYLLVKHHGGLPG